jgi:hypothetical protein
MIRKLSTWLVVALAGGAFLAGCGSSSNSTSSSQTASPPATTSSAPAGTTSPSGTTSSAPARTTSTAATPIPRGATTGPGVPRNASPTQVVAACKQSIQAQPTISASAKTKLEGICAKAGGDRAALHRVAQEVCVELVNASRVPAGASKERALAVCKTQ